MFYALIAIAVVALLFLRLIWKGIKLVELFWDAYRIFVRSGDKEAEATLVIGLTTLGAQHRERLLFAIQTDMEEDRLIQHVANTNSDEKLGWQSHLIQQSESDDAAITQRWETIEGLVKQFSTVAPSVLDSAAIKQKYMPVFPDAVTAINKFKHTYFRKKYTEFQEPTLEQRLKIWERVGKSPVQL